jgi:hypothetical protein
MIGAVMRGDGVYVLPSDGSIDPDGPYVAEYSTEQKLEFFDDLTKTALEWAEEKDPEEKRVLQRYITDRLWDIARGYPFGLPRIYETTGLIITNDYASSALTCGHANEVPSVCECEDNCYCKSHSCKHDFSSVHE